ncbi:expressed unknown protein [Seminavis robusta]|uniref:Uncharacterized protein n=1 Tax=Seminavis robusta TaxID=568900 RepID=A0A9N8EUW1_9STRA|nr:expressed unknown protein [Seminavis robusta]|eukprot:Sro2021_g311450.1 n/a (205) ;mRNA; r:13934-14548
MGPPLNFFMTRLLFMEKSKVNSLKAKSDKASVEIVVDNPRILPEAKAKSLPPIPFPPAAPDSPVAVEGWKGVKVGGWISGFGGSNSKLNLPAVYDDDMPAAIDAFDDMKVIMDDDNTEMTEESNSTTFDVAPAAKSSPKTQLFPANSARNNLSGKKSGSIGRKLGKSLQRPSMKKKGSSSLMSKSSGHKEDGNNSSPSSSGAED